MANRRGSSGSGLALIKVALGAGALSLALAACGRTASDPGDGYGGSDSSGGETTATGAQSGAGGKASGTGGNADGGSLSGGVVGRGGTASSGSTSRGGTASSGSTSRGGMASSGSTSRGGAPSTSGGAPNIDPPHATSQLDILFMIDNSISMSDKQHVLSEAMPQLLVRLITPNCVDASGVETGTQADEKGVCAKGSPEFEPVGDIHIGVVSSSLGAHGGQTCADPSGDDKGQLVPKVRATDPMYPFKTWNDGGFLAWDPSGTHNAPPGEKDFAAFATSLGNMVVSVGQSGCGYEASLEAWYRFLIDPDPPTSVPQVTDPSQATMPVIPPPAQNPVLLQRAAFLRPDSALVIVMLSDENDCSIVDSGQGWLVGEQNLGGGAFHMPRATSACAVNPNDPCCSSCAASAAAPGCSVPGSDPACVSGALTSQEDNLNLRCYDQKRRFGFDLLYPLQRYIDGLSQTEIPNRSGTIVRNPLFPKAGRTPSMVFLSGIVGVPWQDLATKDSLADGTPLEYLTHRELTEQGRWPLVLGSLEDNQPPGDKLMFETPNDRSTLFGSEPHPLLGSAASLVPSSAVGRPNPINGHESNIADNSELQYACIFPLPFIKDCAAGAAACDCKSTDAVLNHAVCNGTSQTHAKAYPGIRELRVLKAFGDLTGNAVPASICPKTLTNTADPSYGYSPAINALVNRLKPVLVP